MYLQTPTTRGVSPSPRGKLLLIDDIIERLGKATIHDDTGLSESRELLNELIVMKEESHDAPNNYNVVLTTTNENYDQKRTRRAQ